MPKNYLVFHHTASSEAPARIALQKKYHRIIDSDGKIYYSLLYAAPGAATFMMNSQTINIALHGNFDNDVPTNHALASLKTVVQEILRIYPHLRLISHGDLGRLFTPRHRRYSTRCCGSNLDLWLSKNLKGYI